MKPAPNNRTGKPAPEPTLQQRILKRPSTRQGWWAVVMAALFVLLYLFNAFVFVPASEGNPQNAAVLPIVSTWMIVCGLAAGIAGLVALLRQGERSWLVWLAMLPALLAIILVLGGTP
jgi:nicotinamide riboside transporter PnuC